MPATPYERELIASRDWFHSIPIRDDVVTPGRAPLWYLQNELASMRFPESFQGQTVLDIGAWDGFFSFEAEKRGASRVVAYDLHPESHYGFAIAKQLLGSRVEYIQGSVYELSAEQLGTFDWVFFLGVFYHLRYPLLALDKIFDVSRRYLLMETHYLDDRLILADGSEAKLKDVDSRLSNISLYQFYRRDEVWRGDFSNWFAANKHAIEDGLWTAGFEPEYLGSWDTRVAYKGTKLAGFPEYKKQTYEGLRYVLGPSGEPVLDLPAR
jgi:tRNA (mo5U34)-methyltransferase